MMIKKGDVIKIVKAGVLAPSGDNCQPWQIYFDRSKLFVKIIESRDTSLYNVKNIASYIASGAMIENIIITAKSLGYSVSVSLFPESEDLSLVAILTFTEGQTDQDPLLPFIDTRCVNRKVFKQEILPPEAKTSLLNVIEKFNGAELYFVEDEKNKKKLSEILSLNDKILFENKNLHDFLFKHLRWSKEEAELTRDGMGIDSLELGVLQSRMFKLLSSWNLVRFLNFFGFSSFVTYRSFKLCNDSPALCMLLMKDRGLESFVNGGRAFQRIWLTASSLDLSLHPVTGVTFLMERLKMSKGDGLTPHHQKLLKNLESKIKDIIPLDENKSIIMAFRLGYADPPSDKSLRLPLDKVLVEDYHQTN